MTRPRPWLAALWVVGLVATAGCVTPIQEARRGFSFALVGDMPYSVREEHPFDGLIDDINADASIAFVLHAGDIKGGGEPCSDALLRARFEQLQRIRSALVYTPGDNEWTDCHRESAGGFNPIERLAFLRRLFFADRRRTTGQLAFEVESQSALAGQSEFVENVLFVRDRVVFATLHVTGSANGAEAWTGLDAADSRAQPRPDRIAEMHRRTAAALHWVDHAFERARATDAAGVLLLMQANPRFELSSSDRERVPFEPLIARLRERAVAFAKPVVLAHGDFHEYIVDRPLERASDAAPNLTRVQTFGSPQLRWVRVTVDPASPQLFNFAPR